jgi:hypothetical protein
MPSPSQRRAVAAHRRRLAERGLGRFEVRGLEEDKDLLRGLARRLAARDDAAAALRADLARRMADGAGEAPRTGGILAALRRSPLVGADITFDREVVDGRDPGL